MESRLWGGREERGKTCLEWGSPAPIHASHHSLWARVFGKVGSGVQLPTSRALSSGTLSPGEAAGGGGPAPLLPREPRPPADPFKTGRAASLCLLKLFSFRTGQRRGAGGGHTCCGT